MIKNENNSSTQFDFEIWNDMHRRIYDAVKAYAEISEFSYFRPTAGEAAIFAPAVELVEYRRQTDPPEGFDIWVRSGSGQGKFYSPETMIVGNVRDCISSSEITSYERAAIEEVMEDVHEKGFCAGVCVNPREIKICVMRGNTYIVGSTSKYYVRVDYTNDILRTIANTIMDSLKTENPTEDPGDEE